MRTLTIKKLVEKYPAIAEFDYYDENSELYWPFSSMLHLFGYKLCKGQTIQHIQSNLIENYFHIKIQKLNKELRSQSEIKC